MEADLGSNVCDENISSELVISGTQLDHSIVDLEMDDEASKEKNGDETNCNEVQKGQIAPNSGEFATPTKAMEGIKIGVTTMSSKSPEEKKNEEKQESTQKWPSYVQTGQSIRVCAPICPVEFRGRIIQVNENDIIVKPLDGPLVNNEGYATVRLHLRKFIVGIDWQYTEYPSISPMSPVFPRCEASDIVEAGSVESPFFFFFFFGINTKQANNTF
ncbi:hypothetical protein RFI_10393 [Reticulomyxa filosa]|uniref:Uncharacterized protein n=1 Tax=Reticulomyxa filosa TaxID=46433 RepID=X6NL71_RETFI|nr:hypothetical protein RFI_10393 [Reticulomyxa filosa]|eukprot:ETO26741.1 hypothetical protein RFI_10393 [Reticulomyxa filosa]